MNDLNRAVAALGESINRTREQASATGTQVRQTRAGVEELGARGIADALSGVKARVHAVDLLLAQAEVGTREALRQADVLRTGELPAPAGRAGADRSPGEALKSVAARWQRERRWRRATPSVPALAALVPVAYLAGRVSGVPRWLLGAAGAGVLAAAGTYCYDVGRGYVHRSLWRTAARPQWQPGTVVDPEARRLVWRALSSGVQGDEESWQAATEQLCSSDEHTLLEALEYILALDAMAYFLAQEERWPSRTETWAVASAYVRGRPADGLSVAVLNKLLMVLSDRRPAREIPEAAALLVPALRLGAWLLGQAPEPMRLPDYFSEIELSLAAPRRF